MNNKANMFQLYESLLSIVKDNKKVNFCSLHFTNSNREGFQYYITLDPMKDSCDYIEITSSLLDSERYKVEYEYGKYRTLNSIKECLSFIKKLIKIKF